MKHLNNKILKYIDFKVDNRLAQALAKLLEKGVKGGMAIDSLILAKNELDDEPLAVILEPLSSNGAKLKNLVLISNTLGQQALFSIARVVNPKFQPKKAKKRVYVESYDSEDSEGGYYYDEEEDEDEESVLSDEFYTNRFLYGLVLNNCRVKATDAYAQLLRQVGKFCTSKLRYLGLAGLPIDNRISRQLQTTLASLSCLVKLDLSGSKVSSFDLFLEVLGTVSRSNKGIQYLNLSGVNATDSDSQYYFVEELCCLVEASESLVHLNLTQCFQGLQVNDKGKSILEIELGGINSMTGMTPEQKT